MAFIKNITLTREMIPLKTPFTTALRSVDSVEFVRVCVLLDHGKKLFGEAPATKAVTGEDLDSIEQDIDQITPKLLNTTPKKALEIIHTATMGNSAKAALDMALFQLPPITNTQTIECDITISLDTTTKMLQDAKNACRLGIKQLKIKLAADISHAIETTRTIAHSLPHAQLLIDANQAWDLQSTLYYIDTFKGYRSIKLIEQPVKADDLQSLKTITTHSPIPILADESAFDLQGVKKVIQNNIADMINIKLMKCGGVSKAIDILEYARAKEISCMLGSMLESPVSINAALDLAFLYRDVIKYVDLDSPLLYKEPHHPLLRYSFQDGTISPLKS